VKKHFIELGRQYVEDYGREAKITLEKSDKNISTKADQSN
jgi:hypothetical protein